MDCPLTPELLLETYRIGVFPMAEPETGEVYWYCPDPRTVVELDGFHVPRTLRRTVAQGKFEIRIDTAFEAVIGACADRPTGECWISPEVMRVYVGLHRLGAAHSVEAWRDGELVGGLYGVAIGGAFFGESMFHRVRDASKVALVALVERLRARGYVLLDTQFTTGHLVRFGAVEIPRDDFLRRLEAALGLDCSFTG